MSKVAIITDTSSCLPKELATKYGIEVIPFVIIIRDERYSDGVDITVDELLSRYEEFQESATTAGTPIPDLLDVYRKHAQRTNDILCLPVMLSFSSMTTAAMEKARELVQDELPDANIEIVNTMSGGGGQGLIVLAAARAAEEGKSLQEVIKAVERARAETEFFIFFDTLEHLVKRGRAPKATSWTSTALNVKPITRNIAGETRPFERVRSKKAGLRRLVEFMEQQVGERRVRVFINHVQNIEGAKWLEEEVSSKFNCAEILLTELTPLIALYTGPGAIAFSFCPEEV